MDLFVDEMSLHFTGGTGWIVREGLTASRCLIYRVNSLVLPSEFYNYWVEWLSGKKGAD